MPRYLVERTFPDPLAIPMDEAGAQVCRTVVQNNAEAVVTSRPFLYQPDAPRLCFRHQPCPMRLSEEQGYSTT